MESGILDIFIQIGDNLQRILDYSERLTGPRLEHAISLIYDDIVEFCVASVKFFRRSEKAPSTSNLASRMVSHVKHGLSASPSSFMPSYLCACRNDVGLRMFARSSQVPFDQTFGPIQRRLLTHLELIEREARAAEAGNIERFLEGGDDPNM